MYAIFENGETALNSGQLNNDDYQFPQSESNFQCCASIEIMFTSYNNEVNFDNTLLKAIFIL
jgi:hypothetical protein